MAKLTASFFDRDVDKVARDLIGTTLFLKNVGGVIVETESYDAADPASHAYQMRRSARNEMMFGPPGTAYVYKSYGIHWCLNFVCRPASAVLIRALAPQKGISAMRRRRGVEKEQLLCSGPGRLCQALSIDERYNGASLLDLPFELGSASEKNQILIGPRIGLTKAKDLHRRFGLKDSPFISRRF